MTMFRRKGGECVATFTQQEAQVLRQCVAELAALLSEGPDPDDPAVERLFPDVYPEDPEAAEEFRRFTEADLRSAKLDQAKTVLSDLLESGGEIRLAEEQADVWLRALTDVRLALGTRLGIERRHRHRGRARRGCRPGPALTPGRAAVGLRVPELSSRIAGGCPARLRATLRHISGY